jgi:hypothetical protein
VEGVVCDEREQLLGRDRIGEVSGEVLLIPRLLRVAGDPAGVLEKLPQGDGRPCEGSSGSTSPIVLSSDRAPRSTSASATAPLNAFEVLAIRKWSFRR